MHRGRINEKLKMRFGFVRMLVEFCCKVYPSLILIFSGRVKNQFVAMLVVAEKLYLF